MSDAGQAAAEYAKLYHDERKKNEQLQTTIEQQQAVIEAHESEEAKYADLVFHVGELLAAITEGHRADALFELKASFKALIEPSTNQKIIRMTPMTEFTPLPCAVCGKPNTPEHECKTITHDEWYAKCNEVERLKSKLKQYKSLLDDAYEAFNIEDEETPDYELQPVNWIHKDIANLLDEVEG